MNPAAPLSTAYKVHLILGRDTHTATAETEAGALALAKAFEIEQHANRDAQAYVWECGRGGYIHSWIGGVQFGPKDTRHPMEKLIRKAVRSGARVTLIDDSGSWHLNHDFTPAGMDERVPARSLAA